MNWTEKLEDVPPEWKAFLKSLIEDYRNEVKGKFEKEIQRIDNLPTFPKCSRDDYYYRFRRETIEELINYL